MTSFVILNLPKTLGDYPDGLIVTSKRYLGYLQSPIDPENIFLVKNADLKESKLLSEQLEKRHHKNILAFGSGKVMDIAKYATSFSFSTNLIALPACLSTNCCFTDKSTLFAGNSKHTLSSAIPAKVIFDWTIIRQNGFMNTCGVVELLSSCPALVDWEIASANNREKAKLEIYEQSEKIATEAIKLLSRTDLKQQLKLLQLSGKLTIEYGCGRPVSGSEHILSAPIENYYRCPHGVALSITIPIALAIQKSLGYPSEHEQIGSNLSKNNPFKNYIRKLMKKSIIEAGLSKVAPRADRYTVLDLVSKRNLLKIARPILNDIFS